MHESTADHGSDHRLTFADSDRFDLPEWEEIGGGDRHSRSACPSTLPGVRGRFVAESLRMGAKVKLAGVELTSVSRHDVSAGTRPDGAVRAEDGAAAGQPHVWTFVDFAGSDDLARDVAETLSAALVVEGGWYADMDVGDDKIVIFADRVFRYRRGDSFGREEAASYGRHVGVPEHQLDWE